MRFEFSESHISEYYQQGFTVFRGIVPTSLLRDLRREADKGRAIAHASAISQRIQPITRHPTLATKPFEDYVALPAVRSALEKLMANTPSGPVHLSFDLKDIGVLYEPREGGAWCTHWHRDWRDNMRGLRLAEWDKHLLDVRYFNQVNAPLYDDSCTWVVPGSHLRRDTPAEAQRFPDRPILAPSLDGLDSVQCEAACLEYTQGMPGAVQAHLRAGDYMVYRNCLWHIGNYVYYRKRATVHHPLFTNEYRELSEHVPYHPPTASGEPAGYENPNHPFRDSLVSTSAHR